MDSLEEVVSALRSGAAGREAEDRDQLIAKLRRLHAALGNMSPLELHQRAYIQSGTNQLALSNVTGVTNLLVDAGRTARALYNPSTSPAHRKKYGQFFTPDTVAALACAAAISTSDCAVIDPMCGDGSMLWAALDRCVYLGNPGNAHVLGVEADPLASLIAALPPTASNAQVLGSLSVICADAFLELTGFAPVAGMVRHDGRYDAVVGNPPYVRYQNLASTFERTNPVVLDAFREAVPHDSDSALVDKILRACLLANLLPDENNLRVKAREAIHLLRTQKMPPSSHGADLAWLKLVANYSGLSDLSVPSWLLTWRLTHPGSIVTYVTTTSWRSREYARFLRYFMLRMLKPLYIVEQDGAWFSDAQIPTSLMVFEVRSADDVAIPLNERPASDHVVKTVRLRHDVNIAGPGAFFQLADTLKGEVVDERTSLARPADQILSAIKSQDRDEDNDQWAIRLTLEQALSRDLLLEDEAATRAGASGRSLRALEGASRLASYWATSHLITAPTPAGVAVIASAIAEGLGLESNISSAFYLLSDLGVQVNQGLRTGCNTFFYVHLLNAAELCEMFGEERSKLVNACLRHPSRYPERFRALMRELSSKGAIVCDEEPRDCQPHCIVRLSPDFGTPFAVLPMAALRPAVRYQEALDSLALGDPDLLQDRVLVTGVGAAQGDFASLADCPQSWILNWQSVGLHALPSGLSEYIELASATVVRRNGKDVRIPELSAVAPNVRRLQKPRRTLFDDDTSPPAPPAWWYSLSIQPRHTGEVFMPRVIDDVPIAYLNSSPRPAIIDANFSTFSLTSEGLSGRALFAILNSAWVAASLEAGATVMGGGALKVEAAHLRLLPLPKIDASHSQTLDALGRELAGKKSYHEVAQTIAAIDEMLCALMGTALERSPHDVMAVLRKVSDAMRTRRRAQSGNKAANVVLNK